MIKVPAVAADVDHGVEGAATSQYLAASDRDHAPVQARLCLGLVIPIQVGSPQREHAGRIMDLRLNVRTACLQQRNPDVRISTQAVGDYAASRTRADYEIVYGLPIVHGCSHASS